MNQVLTPPPIPDDALYEVVRGQRVEVTSMSGFAGFVANTLQDRLGNFVWDHQLGIAVTEMLFILDPVEDERRRPDVAFVAADRWPFDQPIPYQGDWAVVPNLAVEVISPNDALPKVLEKVREYFHFGVQQVWLVIPSERQVYLYEAPARVRILTEADTLDGGTLIPGWKLPLADLFQRRRPAPGAATP